MEEEDGGMDRISELPQPILHRILCFLSHRQSVQTSTLSKSWRHVGSTRPKISLHAQEDFSLNVFKEKNQQLVVSILDNTLQSYSDRRLSFDEFDVRILSVDPTNSIPMLQKWIPFVILDMRVNIFRLAFLREYTSFFDLPAVVFEAESLQVLYLNRCRLNQIENILCRHLHSLNLRDVIVTQEIIEMLLSNCPLIENLSLWGCSGLKKLRLVDKPHALKHINVYGDNVIVEIELPTISTITISRCWLPQHNMYLPHLVRLSLTGVRLSSRSFDFFSCNFPCIQDMRLFHCTGFKEFNLISHSIKNLCILNLKDGPLRKASIDAPSIHHFYYNGPILESFSFATNSSTCRSNIILSGFYADSDNAASEWFDKLNGLLTELRKSEIYLTVNEPTKIKKKVNIDWVFDDKQPDPVVVEHLKLMSWGRLGKYFPAFLNSIFRICRPRYIGEYSFFPDKRNELSEGFEFIHEFFLKEGETRDRRHCFWQRGLEEVSMEALDRNIYQWRCVQSTSSEEGRIVIFRFRLKWREL